LRDGFLDSSAWELASRLLSLWENLFDCHWRVSQIGGVSGRTGYNLATTKATFRKQVRFVATGTFIETAVQPLPIEPGDRLTRVEFERRYDAMPGVKKAELIEGVVCMPSPVRYKACGKPHSDIHGWLFNYAVVTPGVELCDNSTLRLDQDLADLQDGVSSENHRT
jgi:hypothetical protein